MLFGLMFKNLIFFKGFYEVFTVIRQATNYLRSAYGGIKYVEQMSHVNRVQGEFIESYHGAIFV